MVDRENIKTELYEYVDNILMQQEAIDRLTAMKIPEIDTDEKTTMFIMNETLSKMAALYNAFFLEKMKGVVKSTQTTITK